MCIMQFLRDYRLPLTTYAIKQMTLLYPMLEHIEESEKEKTGKSMPMLILEAVLEKLPEHLLQKSHEHYNMVPQFNSYFFIYICIK